MTTVTIVLIFATLICLAIDTTRWLGVVGLAMLFYLHPLIVFALLILGGAALYFIHRHNRSNNHEQPKLPS